MQRQHEKLLPRIEKAGIKASFRAGHPVTGQELLQVKVQLLSSLFRWTLGGISAALGYGSYLAFMADKETSGFGLALLAALFLFFALVGIRRTLAKIVEGLDAASTTELLEAALDGIVSVVGSIFDGV